MAELVRRGTKVTVPSRRRERAKHLILLPTAEVLETDVWREGVLEALCAGHDAVINLIGDSDFEETEQALVEQHGMRFVHIPMSTRKAPTTDELEQFMAVVNDPDSQPVYVHCAGGRHRTGVMTAVYRMTHDGWNSDRAFKEMKQYDFGADFLHPEFKRFVYSYRVPPPALRAPQIVGAADATD